MKRELAILKALIRNFHRAAAHPKIARMLLLPKRSWTCERYRLVASELLLANGDVNRAFQSLSGHSHPWLSKFASWADQARGVK